MPFEKELRIATEAAINAGQQIRRDYETFVAIPNAPASISTETDRASQEIILKYLQSAFPEDALCAEEATDTLAKARRTGRRMWIVDPIDGTRGFAKKNGEFSVMIGLSVDGESVVGVVLEPISGRLTYATSGGGCWVRIDGCQPEPCRVLQTESLDRSTLVQSHSKPKEISTPVKLLKPGNVMEVYSAGVKLALVARGDADLYVNTYQAFSDWDICAGHVLVTEAGGKVTTIKGEEIRYGGPGHKQTGGLLASNGLIHDAAVKAMA